jgi:hypothetical protein
VSHAGEGRLLRACATASRRSLRAVGAESLAGSTAYAEVAPSASAGLDAVALEETFVRSKAEDGLVHKAAVEAVAYTRVERERHISAAAAALAPAAVSRLEDSHQERRCGDASLPPLAAVSSRSCAYNGGG